MKKQIYFIITMVVFTATISFMSSCKKEDEMKPPTIQFKTGGLYTSSDVSLTAGSPVLAGVIAKKADAESESEDVLEHFNISRSLNGGTNVSVYDEDIPQAMEDEYDNDFAAFVSANPGDVEKYTFTVTNRDGLTAQISITITAL
ncbi:MAG: hypothetical protein R2794_01880 [Chitinophagales bacterium]